MSNVLITGATDALSQRIVRNLQQGYVIYFADAQPIPEVMLKSGKYFQIQQAMLPAFAHELLSLALDKEIELIIPLREKEIAVLSSCKILFEEYGINLVVPSALELAELSFIVNPPASLTPSVWLNGNCLSTNNVHPVAVIENRSGVCVIADSDEDFLFCCLK